MGKPFGRLKPGEPRDELGGVHLCVLHLRRAGRGAARCSSNAGRAVEMRGVLSLGDLTRRSKIPQLKAIKKFGAFSLDVGTLAFCQISGVFHMKPLKVNNF